MFIIRKKANDRIQQFKNRLKPLGLYAEVNEAEFYNKVLYDTWFKIENWSSLTAIDFKKPDEENENYLQRRVASTNDYNTFGFFLAHHSVDILDVIEKQNRIVLLGDAGVGKTTELLRIKSHFSKPNSPLTPSFLSLNKYVNENLADLLGNNWLTSSQDRTIVILDGLDEIEAKNKNDAIRKIELFAEQYPACTIIISCRRNFYNQEKIDESGTLRFFSYVLLELDYKDVEKYIQKRLGNKKEIFCDQVENNRLGGLLRVPFYLVSLVKLFETNNNKLPESKAEIFEYLLNDRLKFDSKHFRTTIELDINREKIHGTLERLAMTMTMLGRNYISENEYMEIIPSDQLRNLLKYCTAWKRNEGPTVTWQFEHNNFQEYLAARALSNKPLEVIKDCISFKPDYRKIIPFWVNTLSFLINMSSNIPLLDWVMAIQPEVAVKIEPARIDSCTRTNILKRIFNEYKQKKIWIPFDKYNYRELARFGQSEDATIFLLDEAEGATHYTTRCNAIELLGYTDIQSQHRQRATEVLVKCALTKDDSTISENEEVHAQALVALARLRLNSKEVIDKIVLSLASSKSENIRYGVYYLIHKSPYIDEYIQIFLDGLQYFKENKETDQIRSGVERRNLIKGLEKAKSKESIKKILNYFTQNHDILREGFLDESLITIAENAAIVYSEDITILDLAIDLFRLLANEHEMKEINAFDRFFDKSNSRLQAFTKIFNEKSELYINTLSTLADDECLIYLTKQYEEGKITEKDVWSFQYLLRINNSKLYLPFNKLINEKSGNKFVLPPGRDFEKERKQRLIEDIKLLFNKTGFLNQIKLIFEKEQKPTFTRDEVIKAISHRWDDQFSDLAVYTLLNITKDKPVSLEDAIRTIDSCDWNWFCITEMYKHFENNAEFITDEKKDWIRKWCYSNIKKVNFKTALGRQEDRWPPAILPYICGIFCENSIYHTQRMCCWIWFPSIGLKTTKCLDYSI